jgi:hypothetical protein
VLSGSTLGNALDRYNRAIPAMANRLFSSATDGLFSACRLPVSYVLVQEYVESQP